LSSTLDFLTLVWGERMGWVDIPSKAGGHWIPFSASWPEDRPLIERRIESCLEDSEDVYFSVAMFGEQGRRIKDTMPSRWLWADLDRVDPTDCAALDLTPTVCWESSPFRYQALWKLTKGLKPETLAKVNRALSYTIGADKGGWDLTQVLRPVGTRNFKYPSGPEVMLVYDDGPEYEAGDIWNLVRGAGGVHLDKRSPGPARSLPAGSSAGAGIPARARALLATPAERVVEGERSARLWELSCLLLEAGLGEDEVLELVAPSAWNKWGITQRGLNRLADDIGRAADKVAQQQVIAPAHTNGHKPGAEHAKVDRVTRIDEEELQEFDLSSPSDEYDDEEEEKRITLPFVKYSGFMAQNLEAPRWLIENIWMAQSHGIIGGEAKASKSLLAMAMGLSIASGRPFFGLEQFPVSTPGPVLMVQEENTPWDVQDKLRKMARLYGLIHGADIERTPALKGSVAGQVVRLSFPTDAPLMLLNNFGFDMSDEAYREALEETIQREGASMVVLDPLYLMLGDADADKSRDVRGFQKWLLHLRYTYGCAVVLVHHFGKPRMDDNRRPGHRLLGSGTWYNWVDSALYAEAKEPTDWFVPGQKLKVNRSLKVEREWRSAAPAEQLLLRMHIGKPGSLRLIVQGREGLSVYEEIRRAVADAGEEGILLTELAKTLNLDRRTVRKYTVGTGKYRVEGAKRGRGQSFRIWEATDGQVTTSA
jgi:hypothetical protein